MTRPSVAEWLRQPPVWLVLTALLVIWQAACWLFEPPIFLLPDPISIGKALVDNPYTYLVNAYYTTANTLVGFALSVLIGAPKKPALVSHSGSSSNSGSSRSHSHHSRSLLSRS